MFSISVDITIEKVMEIFQRFACWSAQLGLALMVIMLVYFGVIFLMNRGNPEGVSGAKKGLRWGILGIIVILGAYSIIFSVANVLGGSSAVDFARRILPINCRAVPGV